VLRLFKAKWFGVSVDTVETNGRFAQSLRLDYPILSDSDKTVARSYGVLSATGFPHRWTFYIGKDGRILDVDKNVHPNSHGPDIAKRLAFLGVTSFDSR
jgi:thioredoxin-dependent peroxiredoxin